MIVEGARLDTMQDTVQYELLRSQVIAAGWDGARGNPAGVGLALLLSQGMPALAQDRRRGAPRIARITSL
jgi:hypothetical protein